MGKHLQFKKHILLKSVCVRKQGLPFPSHIRVRGVWATYMPAARRVAVSSQSLMEALPDCAQGPKSDTAQATTYRNRHLNVNLPKCLQT